MSNLTQLTQINLPTVLLGLCAIVFAGRTLWELFEWVFKKLGLEFKWMRKSNEDHELLVATVKNLEALQKKHLEDVESTEKREETLRNDLTKLVNDIKTANAETQKNINQFADNRIHDRQQSFDIQKQLTNSIDSIRKSDEERDVKMEAIIVAQKELLADRINQKYKVYLNMRGIPEDEYEEFIALHAAYKGVGGNHNGDAKFDYCMNNLPILPVEIKLKA